MGAGPVTEAVDWRSEYDRLAAADSARELSPDELERWAVAAFLLGRDDEVDRLRERAYSGYLAAGRREAAVRCIYWLVFHAQNRGDLALASGWMERIRRLVDNETAGSGRLLLTLPDAVQAMWAHRPLEALPIFEAVAAEAASADSDLFVLTGLGRARCLLELRRSEEAAAVLDEAMVHVVSGRVMPQLAGLAYCVVIDVSMSRFDVGRAGEWTRALTSWCDAQPGLVPYRGACLVHRAEILQLHGAWTEAAGQAEVACQRLERHYPVVGGAHYRLAELHRLRGEAAEAESCYAAAAAAGFEVQPGLARLRASQGQVPAALGGLDRALAEAVDDSRRPPLLAARVEICLGAGDVAGARRAADELAEAGSAMPYLAALSATAEGAVRLAEEQPTAALQMLRRAWSWWQEVDAPYEAARTRVLAGAACRALGDTDAARMEVEAARAVFTQLGALADLAALPDGPQRGDHGGATLSPREREVLRLLAAGMSNRAIAAELFLSDRTVARHVSNIFVKLGVSSRSAATAYAYQRGLV